MFLKIAGYLLIAFLVSACATGHHKTSAQLRQLVKIGEFDKAIAYLKVSSLATDEKSKLLFLTELGLLQHYKGDLAGSIETLNSAKTILEQLYTTRVSGKISSVVTNDNADFYYGEKYEVSMVYFYLSLNYYMQAVNEPVEVTKKTLLRNARAEVVAWDSFLTEIKNERLGQALFKEDLLAKTFGALVHESQGNFNDDQIALQLYKDAQKVFFKNYNLFPTFNASYESFRKNFSQLPNLPVKEVEGKYVMATQHSNAFKDFLKTKIKLLSGRVSRSKKKNSNEGGISFLVQDGLIVEKIPQLYEIPMAWGAHASMAVTFGMGAKITYELPSIQGVQKLEVSRLQALNKEGVVLHEAPLSVIAPLSELAHQAINEHSAAVATKTAARVMTKHLSALVASAATYEAGRRQNNTFTMLFASAGHAAAVAAINDSEKADVRFWSTLPSNIRMGHISLPVGVYKFRAIFGQPGALEYRVMELGEHEVSKTTDKFVMNIKNLKNDVDKKPNAESVEIAEAKDRKLVQKSAQRAVSSEVKTAPRK